MAFILPYLGFFLYKLLLKKTGMRKLSAAISSYIGINAAAFCAAVEFGIQPLLFKNAEGQALYCPYPLSVSIPDDDRTYYIIWSGRDYSDSSGTYLC